MHPKREIVLVLSNYQCLQYYKSNIGLFLLAPCTAIAFNLICFIFGIRFGFFFISFFIHSYRFSKKLLLFSLLEAMANFFTHFAITFRDNYCYRNRTITIERAIQEKEKNQKNLTNTKNEGQILRAITITLWKAIWKRLTFISYFVCTKII